MCRMITESGAIPMFLRTPAVSAVLGLWLLAEARGDVRQRGAARAVLLAFAAVVGVGALPHPTLAAPVLAAIDGAILVWLVHLAWKSVRIWPAWTAALQALAGAIHVTALSRRDLPGGAYLAALAFAHAGQGVVLALSLMSLRDLRGGRSTHGVG